MWNVYIQLILAVTSQRTKLSGMAGCIVCNNEPATGSTARTSINDQLLFEFRFSAWLRYEVG